MDKKSKKKVDGSLIRESLVDYNNLATNIKENAADFVRELLGEQVRQAYADILNESEEDEIEDKDYEIEEVEDTDTDSQDNVQDETEGEEETSEIESEMEEEEDDNTDGTEPEETDTTAVEEEGEQEKIGPEFDQYKTEDGKYDLRNAKDEDIVKVYKLLKNDDMFTITKKDGKVHIADNENGAEYLIDLEIDEEPYNDNYENNMNESVIYELALNEYDSHVGYTDNYQKKDVMTTDGVKEPGKGRDIDAGVPKDTAKPWAKPDKKATPFNKKEKANECGKMECKAPEMDEHSAGARMGAMGRMTGVKTHRPNSGDTSKPQRQHNVSVAGEYKGTPTNEEVIRKANKIFSENKKLKKELEAFTNVLKEAAVTNANLGGIIRLISENATSRDEKRDIINRFKNEVHTVEESKNLYQQIANELKKKPTSSVDINEETKLVNNDTQVLNESKFYTDDKLMKTLDVMHKICM